MPTLEQDLKVVITDVDAFFDRLITNLEKALGRKVGDKGTEAIKETIDAHKTTLDVPSVKVAVGESITGSGSQTAGTTGATIAANTVSGASAGESQAGATLSTANTSAGSTLSGSGTGEETTTGADTQSGEETTTGADTQSGA